MDFFGKSIGKNVSETFNDKCSRSSCRSCRNQGLLPVLDLGMMPLSDELVGKERLHEVQAFYPLEMAFCPACSLAQILETVPPQKLFCEDYPYYSSFSQTLLAHSRDNALNLISTRGLNPQSFVVEIASNDGYLLKNFVEFGIEVLGIDPAEGPARAAEEVGVATLRAFFGNELAARLKAEGKQADVIIANNVLAHVADTNGFVEGIHTLLADDGIAVIEVPYVRDLIEHREFDTIYHEHLCYFSVTAVDGLFRRHGLFLNDVERLAIHGGSLRLYMSKDEAVGERVVTILTEESSLGIDRLSYYQSFSRQVRQLRSSLSGLLSRIKAEGKTIAAYGAAAKGAILLNYIGADTKTIDFVVDRNVHKQGKYMPGVHIPICDPARIVHDMPDYVVLLPWNFKEEILAQQRQYRQNGGRFIIPIPTPEVV